MQTVSHLQVLDTQCSGKVLQGYDQGRYFTLLGLYITALGSVVNAFHLPLLKGKNINASFAMLTTKEQNLLQHKAGYVRKIFFARMRKGTGLSMCSLEGLATYIPSWWSGSRQKVSCLSQAELTQLSEQQVLLSMHRNTGHGSLQDQTKPPTWMCWCMTVMKGSAFHENTEVN